MSNKLYLLTARNTLLSEFRQIYDTWEETKIARDKYRKEGYTVIVFECRELDEDGE